MTHLTSQEVGTPSHTAMLNDAKVIDQLINQLMINRPVSWALYAFNLVMYQACDNSRTFIKCRVIWEWLRKCSGELIDWLIDWLIIYRDSLHLDGGQSPESWQRLGCVLAEQELYVESAECLETACRLSRHAPVMPFNVIPRQVHHLWLIDWLIMNSSVSYAGWDYCANFMFHPL